jgi:AhpD family alkylhydroperoxidase
MTAMNAPMLSLYSLRSLARALQHPAALLGRRIGPQLRERIILRVSSINRCAVCSAVHAGVARVEGLSGDDIHDARKASKDRLDERSLIALRYAELRTAGLEADHPDDVAAFEQAFTPSEQTEVRAIVDLFTFNNRFNNTWEAWLPGAQRRRQRMGLG